MTENFSIKQKLYFPQEGKPKRHRHIPWCQKVHHLLLLTRSHWEHTEIIGLNCSCQILFKYSLHQNKSHYLNEFSLNLPYWLRAPRIIHTLVWETRDLPLQFYDNSTLYLGKMSPTFQTNTTVSTETFCLHLLVIYFHPVPVGKSPCQYSRAYSRYNLFSDNLLWISSTIFPTDSYTLLWRL